MNVTIVITCAMDNTEILILTNNFPLLVKIQQFFLSFCVLSNESFFLMVE